MSVDVRPFSPSPGEQHIGVQAKRRATSATDAPGAKLSAMIRCF